MTPFDFSVLIFFAVIFCKALHDSIEFWKEEEAYDRSRMVRKASLPPRHIPAPMRPSPSELPLRSGNAAVRTPIRRRPANVPAVKKAA